MMRSFAGAPFEMVSYRQSHVKFDLAKRLSDDPCKKFLLRRTGCVQSANAQMTCLPQEDLFKFDCFLLNSSVRKRKNSRVTISWLQSVNQSLGLVGHVCSVVCSLFKCFDRTWPDYPAEHLFGGSQNQDCQSGQLGSRSSCQLWCQQNRLWVISCCFWL